MYRLKLLFLAVFSFTLIGSAHEGLLTPKRSTKSASPWDFETMKDYVQSTDFFQSKPCIVFRDIWDPEWQKKNKDFDRQIAEQQAALLKQKTTPSVKIPAVAVDLQAAEDIKEVTLHHAQFFQGSGPQDIKAMHLEKWSDMGYHYIIAQKTEADPFFTKMLPLLIEKQRALTGDSARELEELIGKHTKEYRERRELFEKHKTMALADPRNKGCKSSGENWLVYEARAERFQGAHAGNASLKYHAKEGIFEVVHPVGDDEMAGTKFTCNGKDCPEPQHPFHRMLQPFLEGVGFIQGAYYKFDPDTYSLQLVNRVGQPVLHPATGKPQSVSMKSREKSFRIVDKKMGSFTDGEVVRLSHNYGSLGIVIAGTYEPADIKNKVYYGYNANDPEWKKQPPKEAVSLVGQLINDVKSRYPIEKINSHRSGPLGQKHNCSGGECPGPGAVPMVSAMTERYFKVP